MTCSSGCSCSASGHCCSSSPGGSSPGDGRETIAWAAGLFEGEGCFDLVTRERVTKAGSTSVRSFARARVCSTDEDVVKRFAAAVGFGTVWRDERRPTEKGTPRKPLWSWGITGWDALGALAAMFGPYLGDRRRARLDEILAARPPDYRPYQKVPRGW